MELHFLEKIFDWDCPYCGFYGVSGQILDVISLAIHHVNGDHPKNIENFLSEWGITLLLEIPWRSPLGHY